MPGPRAARSFFPEASGHIPGLIGRLDPKRSIHHGRTYLYASNIAINEGRQQPVHFLLGEDLRLTDADGREMLVRIVEYCGPVRAGRISARAHGGVDGAAALHPIDEGGLSHERAG